jgi:hypothetical protein
MQFSGTRISIRGHIPCCACRAHCAAPLVMCNGQDLVDMVCKSYEDEEDAEAEELYNFSESLIDGSRGTWIF